MEYLKYLLERAEPIKHIIYTLPSSAIRSVYDEIAAYGFKVQLIVPLKNISKHPLKGILPIVQNCTFDEFTVSMIEHDHMRRCEQSMIDVAANSIFIIDEVHKALNETKRTSVALAVSHLAQDFVALTGTPVIDNKTYKLIWWLEQIVDFEVNDKNFWVAANGMISHQVNTGVNINREELLANFTATEQQQYLKLVPPGLGGQNTFAQQQDLQQATNICYQACTREMVTQSLNFIGSGHSVMLVAKNTAHQQELEQLLINNGLSTNDIFLLSGQTSIIMTDEAVASGNVPDYKVVIVPLSKSEGYTLTRLSVMITSVYPSNNATREQLAGRINRIGQKADTIYYRTIHIGILTYIMQKHNDARNLSAVLQTLAKTI